MLCHELKLIFVHIPKTGGQSIIDYLLRLHPVELEKALLRINPEPGMGPPRLAHLFASEYLKLNYVSDSDFRRYFKFSIVRNPWARVVSEYEMQRSLNVCRDDFKTYLFEHFPTKADDDYFFGSDRYRHVMPQYRFLYDDNEQLLVDYVGRFETLQKDFDVICDKAEISKEVLPLLNRGRYFKPYGAYYDDETRAFVAEKYAKDIELFGYQFEA